MQETIAHPPETVFDFITDPGNASKIMESVKSSVKMTDGPVGVGTRFQETRMMNNKEETAELEVTEYKPGARYAVKNVTQGIISLYTYTLKPSGESTQIELECEVSAGGVKKLMVPMVVAILKKEDGDHLQRLKQVMEVG